nr:ribonuclease H-like domain-containing protein [Tanacetum cinerariifolium]
MTKLNAGLNALMWSIGYIKKWLNDRQINRVLVTKPHNKTPYELLHGQTPSIGFMRPFGCHVTILNTLDPLGKFEGNVDEGFLVGYSVNSKAFRVFNNRTRIVQETLHSLQETNMTPNLMQKKQGRQADIYQIDMDHAANEIVSVAAFVPTVIAAPVKVVVPSIRRRRGVVIRDPEEESSAKTPTETKSKDKRKGIMIEESKPMKKKQQRYQVMKKRPQTEAQAQRNMMTYLKNIAGFRLDSFKGMSYDDILPIFEAKFNANMEFLLKSKEQIEEEANRAIESINETQAQKAANRRRLNE